MTRTLALCADDYGQGAAVDRGILRLARRRRLTAVSCLTNGDAWTADAAALLALPGVADESLRVGLHFNLTQGRPLSRELARHWPLLPALPRLLLLAHLRAVPRSAVAAELRAQWQAFAQAAGRPPMHLDGHQHVHHLPGVREAVLALAAEHPGLRVRGTGDVGGSGHRLKRSVMSATGGRWLQRALQHGGALANTTLLGVYDFMDPDYRSLVQGWLAMLPASGALVFCHPGEAAPVDPNDAIAQARVRELAYLDSDAFLHDLQAVGVRLGHAA